MYNIYNLLFLYVISKNTCHFYFYDNFGERGLIFIIFHC